MIRSLSLTLPRSSCQGLEGWFRPVGLLERHVQLILLSPSGVACTRATGLVLADDLVVGLSGHVGAGQDAAVLRARSDHAVERAESAAPPEGSTTTAWSA